MRSRLAARSARLVLAAAAVTALAATTTACRHRGHRGSRQLRGPLCRRLRRQLLQRQLLQRQPFHERLLYRRLRLPWLHRQVRLRRRSKNGSGDGGKSGYGQSCGTNDLDFTVTSESQAGGYYLVTAKAKSGITCYLDVNTPSVSFGSGADGVASPVGQGGEDPIKLTGSAVAYTGISPKTTKSDAGKNSRTSSSPSARTTPTPPNSSSPTPPTSTSPLSPTGPPTAQRPSPSLSDEQGRDRRPRAPRHDVRRRGHPRARIAAAGTTSHAREQLDRLEEGGTRLPRSVRAVANRRVLVTACSRCQGTGAAMPELEVRSD